VRKIQVLTAPRRPGEEPNVLGMLIDPENDEAPYGLGAGASLLRNRSDKQIAFEQYWMGWSNGSIQTQPVTP
jgi:hypothetical protein